MEMKNPHATKRHNVVNQAVVQMNFVADYSFSLSVYISS